MHVTKGRFEEGHYHLTRGLRLNPNYADFYGHFGRFFAYFGEPKRALNSIARAQQLNPLHPDWYWEQQGVALYGLNRYRDAIEAFRKIQQPSFYEHLYMAACHVELDEQRTAEDHIEHALADKAGLCVGSVRSHFPYRREIDREHLLGGLRKAGLPE